MGCAVYPKKYAHGFCFAVLCCGYTLTDFPISTRLTSLALWQSNDCPSASKATLMNMDKYFMWMHYERLHNHNKAKHNKTVCIFLYTVVTYPCPWYLLLAHQSWYKPTHMAVKSDGKSSRLAGHVCNYLSRLWFNTLRPRRRAAISQTTLSNAFSWMIIFEFRIRLHGNLFQRVQLTIFQHWFR